MINKIKDFIKAVKEENKTLSPKEQREFIISIIVVFLFSFILWGGIIFCNIYALYTIIKFWSCDCGNDTNFIHFSSCMLIIIIISFDAAIYFVSREVIKKIFKR